MPTIVLNKFDGGHAEDIRTFATNQSEFSKNFDIFTNPHKLLPFRDVQVETVSSGTLTDFAMSGVVYTGTQYITVGRTSSGSAVPKFFAKTLITDNWQATNTGPAGSTVIPGTLVLYKGVAYTLAYNSSNQNILVNSSGTSVTTITGSTVANAPLTYTAKPFVHPEDNCLYMVFGKVIAKLDSTLTWSESSSILPTDAVCPSITDYGTYLAIACITGGKSIVYLWGRDLTLNTLQGTLPFGEGIIVAVENLGNSLVGAVNSSGSLALGSTLNTDIKVYSGGEVATVKSVYSTINNYKTKYDSGLYLGSNTDDCIYLIKKNKEGYWSVTKDRYIFNGASTTDNVVIPTIVNGILWTSFSILASTGQFYRTTGTVLETPAYTAISTFRTTINPDMPLADRYRDKQLMGVRVSFTAQPPGAFTSDAVIKYSVDGSSLATALSSSKTVGEYVIEATNDNNGDVFLSGKEFQFEIQSTDGAQIKELAYKYVVLNSAI